MTHTPSQMPDDQFLQTAGTDARLWADEFCRINPAIDKGFMIGWFANCIEATRAASVPSDKERAEAISEIDFRNLVEEALNDQWNDWVGDTGCFPSDFQWSGGNGVLSFSAGKWASHVATQLWGRINGRLRNQKAAPDQSATIKQLQERLTGFEKLCGVDNHDYCIVLKDEYAKQSEVIDKLVEALKNVKSYIEQEGQQSRDLYPVFGLDGQRVRDLVNETLALAEKARGA